MTFDTCQQGDHFISAYSNKSIWRLARIHECVRDLVITLTRVKRQKLVNEYWIINTYFGDLILDSQFYLIRCV